LKNLIKNYQNSSLVKRIFLGAGWGILGVVVERLIIMLIGIIIVRSLSNAEYGQFAIIQSTLSMVGIFAGLGLGTTATKYVAELKLTNTQLLSRIFNLISHVSYFGAGFIVIILYVFSDFIARDMLNAPALSLWIALGAIAVFFNSVDGFQIGVLMGLESVKHAVISSVCAALTALPITIFLVKVYGFPGAVIALVVTAAIRWIISFQVLRHNIKKWNISRLPYRWKEEGKILRNFAFPALMSGLMIGPAHWICHAMLMHSPEGDKQMAVIGITTQWFYALMFIPAAANRIILPVLTDMLAAQEQDKSQRILRVTMLANLIVILPISMILVLISPYIMSLYGVDYRADWMSLVCAVLASAISVVCMPLGQFLAASSKMWIAWLINLGWASVYILSTYFLLGYGALGVTVALLIAYLVHALWSMSIALYKN
jgi:O-antigen/teichoic acid export membrane protein